VSSKQPEQSIGKRASQKSSSWKVINQSVSQPNPNQQFYGHYTGQPALAGMYSYELEDFVGAKFYCPHALAGGNQRIRIRQKTREFSLTVLSARSPYQSISQSKNYLQM